MSRGFLILSVDGEAAAVFSKPARLGDPSTEEVAKFARKHGYEIKFDGQRRTFDERKSWALTIRAYTSFRSDGYGRAGSCLWSYPARPLPCGYCRGRGRRGGGPFPDACKRCFGSGLKRRKVR